MRRPGLTPRVEQLEARDLLSISAFPSTANGIGVLSDQLPANLSDALVRPYWPGDAMNLFSDWGNFCHKLTFFVIGFALASATWLAASAGSLA